jgi:hypothetical protein
VNTFPTYSQAYTDNPRRDDSVMRARTTNMVLTAWRLSASIKKEIVVLLPHLPQADVDTILAFEAANQDAAFYFTWAHDGVTYTVMFSSPVQIKPATYGFYDVKFTVGEV